MKNKTARMGLGLCLLLGLSCALILASLRTVKADANWGFSMSNLDKTCKPCADFYQFAMGGWMKSNAIPPEYSTWGSFTVLRDKNLSDLRAILEEAAKENPPAGSDKQKIADFYGSCMDSSAIDAAGLKPLAGELAAIEEVQDRKGLETEIANLQQELVNAVFRFSSAPDFKDSSRDLAHLIQGGLGMPDRDYYLRE